MTIKLQSCLKMLLAGLLVLSLAACTPDDGDDGAPGADGAAGAPGADGEDGQDVLPLAENVIPLNPVIDLSSTVAYDAATQKLTIHFFLTDGHGNGVDVINSDAYDFRFYVAELIPDTTTGIDPGTGETRGQAWNRLIYESGTPMSGSLDGELTLLDAATGEYNYVIDGTLAPSDRVQRVTIVARWQENINGMTYRFANPVNAHYDFRQSAPSLELLSSGADIVLTENCVSCHANLTGVDHGRYTSVKTCNLCHNVNYMATRNDGEGDLAFMVHRIHSGGTFDELGRGPGGADFSEVVFPQSTANCETCHGGAPQGDLHFLVPTIRNCTACHATTTFTLGGTHPGGTAVDGECTNCHKPGGVPAAIGEEDIVAAHSKEYLTALQDTPEFGVTIELLDPGTGLPYPFVADVTPPRVDRVFMDGEQPIVRVTLKDRAGDPIPGTVYTTARDAAGVTGGGLRNANLYVYGPRADALPVLTVDSTTDGDNDQGRALFVGADPQVMTDTSGFKYQLMDDIDQLEQGTYMVRFEGGDYGGLSSSDYVTASSGLINFQVKTADVEHKVAGDSCMESCHGDSIKHLTGTFSHHAPFDTDHCLGCHDLSNNYADYIGNRVHAIHRASITGDLHVVGSAPNQVPRDWSEIVFPQEPNNCTICHTNLDPEAPVWRTPDAVACGGCHGAFLGKAADPDYAEAIPESFPTADQDRVRRELAAAQHMSTMGGDFDPAMNPQTQCIVCHGAGRIADLYVTHKLVTFPLPPLVDDDT